MSLSPAARARVVLGLPEDMLAADADVADAQPAIISDPQPAPAAIDGLRDILEKSERPLMIVGGPGWSRATRDKVQAFSSRFGIPVATSFRCQDYIDNRQKTYVGHAGVGMDPALAQSIKDADTLLVVGSRLRRDDDGRLPADRHPNAAPATCPRSSQR